MANADEVYEKWRKNASLVYQDDRYTVLFNELVEVFRDRENTSVDMGFYLGMRAAYCLLTGDSDQAVEAQVARAAQELVAS